VLNELGHGLLEKPYENALVVEFGLRAIPYVQQRRYDVLYKTVKVGEYVPDLIAFGAVVVDSKVIERISDWVDPERLSGAPCFKGTRVPVDSLFTNLESGLSLDEYLDCFPDVTREQAVAVLEYAHKLTLQPAA
jgi:uncharacterized protein (DUF433 family)